MLPATCLLLRGWHRSRDAQHALKQLVDCSAEQVTHQLLPLLLPQLLVRRQRRGRRSQGKQLQLLLLLLPHGLLKRRQHCSGRRSLWRQLVRRLLLLLLLQQRTLQPCHGANCVLQLLRRLLPLSGILEGCQEGQHGRLLLKHNAFT